MKYVLGILFGVACLFQLGECCVDNSLPKEQRTRGFRSVDEAITFYYGNDVLANVKSFKVVISGIREDGGLKLYQLCIDDDIGEKYNCREFFYFGHDPHFHQLGEIVYEKK